MNRVDRVILQVQRAYGSSDKQLSLGLIVPTDNGKWEAQAHLWDGKTGSQKPEDRITSVHDTVEECIQALEAIAEAHAPTGRYKPLFQDVPIIIEDIPQ